MLVNTGREGIFFFIIIIWEHFSLSDSLPYLQVSPSLNVVLFLAAWCRFLLDRSAPCHFSLFFVLKTTKTQTSRGKQNVIAGRRKAFCRTSMHKHQFVDLEKVNGIEFTESYQCS